MAAARAALFALAFYPGTLLFVIVGLLAGLFSTSAMLAVVHAWARFHHGLAEAVLGIRTRVEGAIPPGPYLIAVKHQSMFETIEMVLIARIPIIVLKRELADLPLFGHITRRYGVIPVDREAGAKALRDMLGAAKAAAATGRPIIIYPEGTRVAPGTTPPLRAGFAGLYRALGLPVVPVAMDSGRLFRRGLGKRSGTVHFRIGEVIPAGLKREDIEARVHAAINALEKPIPPLDCEGRGTSAAGGGATS
jgi:1-acyl-sn-glycerol-3-phosphate acyltransferase